MAQKIMLVEDDTNLSEIYAARLIAEGYAVISARDGEDALALAVKEHPDLIITDVMMPKISGFDMLDVLRSTDGIKDIKVIMMTALGQAEDKQRAEKLGVDRYLVKSQVTLEDVIKAVKDVMGESGSDTSTPTSGETATPPTSAQPMATSIPIIEDVPEKPVSTSLADMAVPAEPSDTNQDNPPTPPAEEPKPTEDSTKPQGELDIKQDDTPKPDESVNATAATADAEPVKKEESAVLGQIQDFLNKEEDKASEKADDKPKSNFENTVDAPSEETNQPVTDSTAYGGSSFGGPSDPPKKDSVSSSPGSSAL